MSLEFQPGTGVDAHKTPILVLRDATGGEPQQVLQILPTTPAEPAASSRVSHARASLASQEEVRKWYEFKVKFSGFTCRNENME